MVESKKKIEELKIEYDLLDYDLPSFKDLLDNFNIMKVCEKDSGYLLRDIRMTIMEKLNSYFQLFELFLNPVSPSLFIISVMKYFDLKDKELIKKIYNHLSKINIVAIKLDTIYDEKEEAKFIKKVYDEWDVLKKDIYSLFDKIDFEVDKTDLSNGSNYFG